MDLRLSQRITNLSNYAFAEVDNEVAKLKAAGITPIDFGVGDPLDPTPEFIREALKKAADTHKSSGYPSYIGSLAFRQKVAEWSKWRFGVDLDPATEISSTIGSKEAVFNFPLTFVDPGDIVISPTPGYPPYQSGTRFAGGINYLLPLREANGFLPDLSEIPDEIAAKTKLIWICSPSNPTGAVATDAFWEEAIAWAKKWNVVLASDECYSENYYDPAKKPRSVLEFTKEGVVCFGSLSKRSNMTGYRVGWVAGDPKIIGAFRKIKPNIDSGTPTFIQDAAVAALSDETHVAEMRQKYTERKALLFDAFRAIGLPVRDMDATFYIWQRAPQGMTGLEFAKKLLDPKIAVVVTPGAWISDSVNGENPGENYVRFALIQDLDTTKEAARRIKENF